jgi:hypothetical protein
MMTIVESKVNRKIFLGINHSEMNHRKGIFFGLHDGGIEATKELKRRMELPKTGRVYFFRGRAITASKPPDEAPAVRSGRLYRSVSYRVRGPYEMEFGERTPYAEYLEATRPHVSAVGRDKAIDVLNSITDSVNKEINI